MTFESGLVRPLALSPDGSKLFAVNTPDDTLEIFDVTGGGISHSGSVPVGMEPVAVAARTNTEVWVVNTLSDSVSIVDLSGTPHVIRTLLVGDEPQDIVFAGTGGDRAFITTAHRGQNSPFPRSEYDVPGGGRADVWVFDPLNLGTAMGGTPLTVVTLFGDKPRALAVSPDGSTVYAAVFRSGNQTTSINEGLVCNTNSTNIANETVQPACNIGGQTMPGGSPPPHKNQQGIARPETGLILKLNRDGGTSNQWQDELGRNWNNAVKFNLPDEDVFEIDADANPPVETDSFSGVGTILFNMVTNPITGALYVSNTDAQNHVRFEGPGIIAAGIKPLGEPATVRGNLAHSQITVIDGGGVMPRHLNKHINYSTVPVPAGVKEDSLATPVGMAVSDDGSTLYVAAFGSSAIGVFDTAALENDTFTPDANDHIPVSGGGPAGLILDGDRLYTLTRFNNSVAVVDLTLGSIGQEVQSVALHNPEPASVVIGRPFLYDAISTGSNGEASCSSCHIFGDMDDLAWDLGNPDDDQVTNNNPFEVGIGASLVFHPMKGPMTTQSMRGLVNMGPQHWRGDRQGNSTAAFNAFNVAFPGLVGRDEGQFVPSEMQKFTDFALQITYPPNPIRQLDNSLRADEQTGFNLYNGAITDTVRNCNGCHALNPANGFFGGDGDSSVEGETQEFKIPHLRNAYQKIGMFGMASTPGLGGSFAHQGDQVRGFGFLHDGSIDNVFRFLSSSVFSLTDADQDNLEAFVMAYPSDLPPFVGQQITRTSTNGATVDGRIDEMIAAASAAYPSKLLGPGATQCDVIVKGTLAGQQRGGVLIPGVLIQPDDGTAPIPESTVRALSNVAGQELTYTCVPFGSGTRMGVDRDLDGFFDFVEVQAGSDPADPNSVPASPTATPTGVPTGTATATVTPTSTPTSTPTTTPTNTPTFTMTSTPTATATNTWTPTPASTTTPTATPTNTVAASPTSTPTGVPTGTATATVTPTSTPSGTPTPTLTPTSSPEPSATETPTVGTQCASGILLDKAKVRVARNDLPAGDEKLTLKGELIISTTPPIDPIANGFSFDIVDRSNGTVLVSRVVPGGASPGSSIPGWRVNSSQTRWTFKDRTGTLAGGITKVSVKDKSARTPGLFQVRVKGKDGDFRFTNENVELVVVLGGPAQAAADQCATRPFNVSTAPAPNCELSSSGRSIRCK